MTWKFGSRTAILCGVSLAAMSMAGAAAAQSAPPAADSGVKLEEVVVTARRTEERLQDTPISVSAVTGDTLERMNVAQVSDVAQFVPNLVLTQGATGPTNANVFIRGIGGSETLLTVDSPVGVYMDGVYLGRANALNTDLVDLARIEVLRGPQGTLFGRNTSAGAVNMVTRDPATSFGLKLGTGWGQSEGWYARGQVDTGELGASGFRASLSYMHRARGGLVDNPATDDDHDPGARRGDSVFFKLLGDVGPLRVVYALDYNDVRGQNEGYQLVAMGAAQQAYFGQSAGLGGPPLILTKDRRDTLLLGSVVPFPDEQHSKVVGHALTLTYAVNDVITLKSITAYRTWDSVQPTNYGPVFKGPVNSGGVISTQNTSVFSGISYSNQSQTSQEFQLLAKTDHFSTVAGLYYFQEDVKSDNPTYFTFVSATGNPLQPYVGSNLSARARYNGASTSYAAFGQTTWKPPVLDDKLSITAGLRYTQDNRTIYIYNLNAVPRSGERDYHDLSYNVSIDYHWTDAIMTFARAASGYRAGGFNARQNNAAASIDFFPEKATTYEVGVKADFFEHRLRTNATVFYTKYDNFQVTQYTGGTGTTTNADAVYKGGEIEIQAALSAHLLLDANLGYTDPEYDYYPYSNPATNLLQDYSNIAHFPYEANLTTHLGAQYTFDETPLGKPIIRVDFSTMSHRYFHGTSLSNANPLNNTIVDPGRQLLSARFILAEIPMGNARGEFQIYGTNLLDDEVIDSAIDFGSLGFAGVSFGPPRSFGFDFKIRY